MIAGTKGTDLLISFDTTGSMSPCIAQVRREVTSALSYLFGNVENLRVAIIAHGDYCDMPHDLMSIDFTSDIGILEDFVRIARNTSGGDGDEYYEYILQKAQGFNWQAERRIMIMIGDAEPHEVGYRYNGKVYQINWKDEARKLAESGVTIYPVQALGGAMGSWFYNELARIGNGRKINLNQFTDSIPTITAISFHGTEQLEVYKQELQTKMQMNRNLAHLFETLGSKTEVKEVFTRKDDSGLIPVHPARFQIVNVDHNIDIASFVNGLGIKYKRGRGFYELMKTELIQEHKEVILMNRVTGDMFTGDEARNFIGLPYGSRGMVNARYRDTYRVFVQSTSSNRKLIGGYLFLYENDAV